MEYPYLCQIKTLFNISEALDYKKHGTRNAFAFLLFDSFIYV